MKKVLMVINVNLFGTKELFAKQEQNEHLYIFILIILIFTLIMLGITIVRSLLDRTVTIDAIYCIYV